jgi:hypothetical protein
MSGNRFSAPLFSKFVSEHAETYHELRKRGTRLKRGGLSRDKAAMSARQARAQAQGQDLKFGALRKAASSVTSDAYGRR